MLRILPLFVLTGLIMISCTTKNPSDMLFFNGIVHTMDDSSTIVDAFAVRDGRIVATGSNEDILSAWEAARVIDLEQQHVFPGFIDAHAHLFGLGEEDVILGLLGTTSPIGIAEMVRDRASSLAAGTWIRGRGWDQNDWGTKEFPGKELLDATAPTHPVFLSRIDGHAAWVNSRALELSGITRATPDPEGGRIVRGADGEATGILLDQAIELVRANIPQPAIDEMAEAYATAIQRCLAVGMTGMHDMGLTATGIEAMRLLIARNEFPFHVVGYIDDTNPATWETLLKGGRQTIGNQQLVLAGLKLYADGALGSRGAWLLEDYTDDAGNRGIPIQSEEVIRRESERALRAGLQVCVHAIGDAAVRRVLDAYEQALKAVPRSEYPLRIEHAQVIDIADIPRFARLGVIPSMQPTHCTSDMTWAEARLGARRVQEAYAWAALINSGAWIPGGSDFPVERPDPIAGIYAASFRKDAEGRPASPEDIKSFFQTDPSVPFLPARWTNGWFGEQCMSRENAIRAFTIWAARAAGLEKDRGSIEKGKWADCVILSEDLATVPRSRFLNTRVLATWVAGEQVFTAPD
ncbi:MAG: amidohydrolase [Bacteroidetes bacterium]|nr:amidohydrolase [Bacteroidota bacterium]